MFIVNPFNAETDCLKAPLVTDEAAAELEMIDLCEEDQLKPAFREGTTEFWKSVPVEKYPNVKQAALKILSMFGSTYVCKSMFSTLKHVKSKHRSVLTDTHSPFSKKTWDTCAVVGNGGILTNSSCGNAIDSAQFVIRCNLPPLGNGYEKHVGVKTDFVTANPSIFAENYGALMESRRPFAESLHSYGNSLLLLPAFSYSTNTPVSLRAFYTIKDFENTIKPVFLNPEYVESLNLFWHSWGLTEVRLSTGFTMVSLALELCTNVDLYGFWPFNTHPYGFHNLNNHYYDDRQPKKKVHAMPTEFELLLQLHSQGILRLHLGDCQPGGT
uniref:ST8 alpha-N-acetyl-neuraminide alpha-2,8-sialyltransferase 6 n=1 Tax=Stegastes partitus TaxID=144197 RepID=A0A3B5AMR8_9TELE